MSFEKIAAQLGAEGVGSALDRLRRFAPLVGYHSKGCDDRLEQFALEGALNLQVWVHVYALACDRLGEDEPECVAQLDQALEGVLPFIAQMIKQGRRGGPEPDDRRLICAEVCAWIWRDHHDSAGLNSDTLLAACEAYWQACGQRPTAADRSGHLRNWRWFLTSNSREKSEVR